MANHIPRHTARSTLLLSVASCTWHTFLSVSSRFLPLFAERKDMDKDMKKVAEGWAEKVLQDICKASMTPEYGLEGESLKVYRDMKEWGWLDDFPIDKEGSETVLMKLLSQQKYAKLKWQKDHPSKPKPSKWEKVMGKVKK